MLTAQSSQTNETTSSVLELTPTQKHILDNASTLGWLGVALENICMRRFPQLSGYELESLEEFTWQGLALEAQLHQIRVKFADLLSPIQA